MKENMDTINLNWIGGIQNRIINNKNKKNTEKSATILIFVSDRFLWARQGNSK